MMNECKAGSERPALWEGKNRVGTQKPKMSKKGRLIECEQEGKRMDELRNEELTEYA